VVRNDTALTAFYSSFVIGPPAVGDVIMVALDADADRVWFGRNGVWPLGGDPGTGTGGVPVDAGVTWRAAVSTYWGCPLRINLGQLALRYNPPAGFPPGFDLP
jgi:hypothetical protein